MNPWLENALSRATQNIENNNDCLSSVRASSLAQLQSSTWPTRKTEDWKYTSLKTLEAAQFNLKDLALNYSVEMIDGLNSIDIVFVDGKLITDLSQLELPKGISITDSTQLDSNEQNWVSKTFGSVKPQKHLFGLVNDVLAENSLVMDVAADISIDNPIRIIHFAQLGVEGHSRVLVRLGDASKAVVIEEFQALNTASSVAEKSFTTGFAEFHIGANAELEHYRFELQTGFSLSAGGSHFSLADKSKLDSTLVGFGSELSRTDVDILYKGEFANAKMNAIYLLKGNERFDLHSTIEHEVPNCTSLENVRGIVADTSQATFNGRIHIHRDAQKTLAELNNRNLLLSDKAQINTKPELEIYADDVRCAHGATIAELDKDALYYLMSRGLAKEKALVMLNFGFINALVDEMPNQLLAEWLRPKLQNRFAEMGK